MRDVMEVVASIAGIGGIAIALALYVFRDIIRKKIFPTLQQKQAYRLIGYIIAATTLISLAGIVAWVIVKIR